MKRKKLLIIILAIAITIFISASALAASVDPIEMPGNDINDQDMITPDGCVFYSFENNEDPGTYTVNFNLQGEVEPGGPLVHTVVIGQQPNNSFTEVLSWTANFPVYAVIVKGGPNYNLYIYDTATSDTNLVSPDVPSGMPADVSHTSIIFCPPFMPVTPTPTPPPPPVNGGLDICICLIWISIVVITFILGFLVCGVIKHCCKKNSCCRKNDDCF